MSNLWFSRDHILFDAPTDISDNFGVLGGSGSPDLGILLPLGPQRKQIKTSHPRPVPYPALLIGRRLENPRKTKPKTHEPWEVKNKLYPLVTPNPFLSCMDFVKMGMKSCIAASWEGQERKKKAFGTVTGT